MEMHPIQPLSKTQIIKEFRGTLILNSQTIKKNLNDIQSFVDDNAQSLLVLKANAYGIGVEKLVDLLKDSNVHFLGVVSLTEALELRGLGVQLPILLMMEPDIQDLEWIVKHNISFCLYTFELLQHLSLLDSEYRRHLKIHIKIDLGMGRLGCSIDDFFRIYQQVEHLNLHLEGICSHFSSIQNDLLLSEKQLQLFLDIKHRIERMRNFKNILFHMANTLAAKKLPNSRLDMIRIGFGLYKDAIELKTKVHFIKSLKSNSSLGYDQTYLTQRDTHIAIIPLGYADGIPHQLANVGNVSIKGKIYPIVGKICMDWFMVDLGENNNDIQKNDEVLIISPDFESLNLENISSLIGVDPRLVLCHLGNRIERVIL